MYGGFACAGQFMTSRCSSAHSAAAFQTECAAIETKAQGRLGVTLLEEGTGRSFSYRADERFPMCSTAKVLVCGAVLARVDTGKESLDRRIRYTQDDLVTYSPATKDHVGDDGMTLGALCEAALTLSDNTAMNLLEASVGGPSGVTSFARSIGDPITRLDRTETTLNEAFPGDPRDTSTPNAMASTLHKLVLGSALSPASRKSLASWMMANTTGSAKLRAGVPQTWKVGDKTGTGNHGTSNDIGVFWRQKQPPICAIVYLTGAESIPESARAAASAEVGRIAGRFFAD